MFIKIMAGDGVSDTMLGKEYELIECKEVEFHAGERQPNGAEHPAWAMIDHVRIQHLHGNVYVLNAAGKTIDTYYPILRDKEGVEPTLVTT